MSSAEHFKEFINDRLAAAAEEIFRVFKKTVTEYEEEIGRQRRLLDIVWKPEIKIHRIDLPQQQVLKEEDVLADSSLDEEDPQLPQIKEEQEELCTSQEREQLEPKQEADAFTLTPTDEESDHGEDLTLNFNPDEALNTAENESVVPVIYSVISEAHSDHLSHNSLSQDQKGGEHGDSGSTRNAEPKPNKKHHQSSDSVNSLNLLESHTPAGKWPFRCDKCGKDLKHKSSLGRHLRIHIDKKPYACNECGKRFSRTSTLKAHMTLHTGDRPYSCSICERRFCQMPDLKKHMKIHTGEKPYTCRTCGRSFRCNAEVTVHMRRAHTGEKPFACDTCGKSFYKASDLNAHMRTHTAVLASRP
ncbi:zinc finger protein 239-like isoform X4 [Epinephelus fuscoguttatus]|uniref:zinc finger protein 239-like isoform X4 n=1 Tax=Epinephelus fuscoguttatus TaxID=293821 RepID=UPI0020D1D97F|nr:zinc finger protein 239-like isoform X4 [Epinephelus fuscoguttatus]